MYAEIKDDGNSQVSVPINGEKGNNDNGAGNFGNYGTSQIEHKEPERIPEEYLFGRKLRILSFVGTGIVLAGLIVELSGLSAAGETIGYLDVMCILVPIVELTLNYMNKIRLSINHVTVIILCTLVSTMISFFRLVSYAVEDTQIKSNGALASASAGAFFVSAGEACILVATALVVKGL